MGQEVFYFGSGDFRCPNCDEHIEITYDASEYPVGALNYSEVNVNGGKILRGFGDIEIGFGEEMYSFDDEVNLYLKNHQQIITSLTSSASDLIQLVSKKPIALYEMSPRDFEELVAEIFSRNGFKVELTQKTRDGGKDIIAVRSDLGIKSKYIIECKRYAKSRLVGVDLVRNLYGVQMQEGANKSVLATTSRFTKEAQTFAQKSSTTQWAMDLKGYNDIVSWINSSKI